MYELKRKRRNKREKHKRKREKRKKPIRTIMNMKYGIFKTEKLYFFLFDLI